MTTNTAQVSPPVRVDPRQVLNTLKQTINFNDAGASSGILLSNSLPKGAVITDVIFEIITAFNAATTNPITVGVGALTSEVVNAAGVGTDADPTVVGVTKVGRAIGQKLANAADLPLYYSYIPTGGGQTTGQAQVTIVYEGGWAS